MAKQLGIYQFQGKLGQAVGAKKAAGQKTNVVRQHVATIANPKTLAQCKQRMKTAPAVNFYRALAGLLDHSWQGVKYGGASHNKFNHLAMLMNSGFPYVAKGETKPFPGRYPIARGSLAEVNVRVNDSGHAISSIACGSFDGVTTIGELANAIIAANPTIKSGDQLTFIYCAIDDPDMETCSLYYAYDRVVLDGNDTTPLSSLSVTLGALNGSLMFALMNDYWIIGAAVVVSRPPRLNGGAWQRSFADFSVNATIANVLFSGDRYAACIASYGETSSEATSDWYLNQGNEGGGSTEGNGGTTAGRSLIAANWNGIANVLFMVTNGRSRIVVSPEVTVNGVQSRYCYIYDAASNTATRSSVAYASTEFPSTYSLIATVQNNFPSLIVDSNEAAPEEAPVVGRNVLASENVAFNNSTYDIALVRLANRSKKIIIVQDNNSQDAQRYGKYFVFEVTSASTIKTIDKGYDASADLIEALGVTYEMIDLSDALAAVSGLSYTSEFSLGNISGNGGNGNGGNGGNGNGGVEEEP